MRVFQAHIRLDHPYFGWQGRMNFLLATWNLGLFHMVRYECATCFLYFSTLAEADRRISGLNHDISHPENPTNNPVPGAEAPNNGQHS